MLAPTPSQLELFTTLRQAVTVVPPGQTTQNAGNRSPTRKPTQTKTSTTLEVCVLGSGSGGNATVLRYGDHCLLIDAGLGPRTTAQRLAQAGLTLTDLSAICVTHFDTDHFRKTWVRTMVDLGITLHCHDWHLLDLKRVQNNQQLFSAGLVKPFADDTFSPWPETDLTVSTVRLQHDRQGTIGYRFDTPRSSVGLATDLGHAPEQLCRHLAGVDVLCIEANYDEHMTTTSSRPSWVNRRNLSDSGHLSNEQSLAAVQRIAQLSPHGNPRRVVLLHRSSQCNHPTKVRRCFERDPAIVKRVIQTEQRRRTRWIKTKPMPAVRRCQFALTATG